MDDTRWLIAREIPHLRRYALALVGDEDRADDLVQDCLERALRKRHLWRRRGRLRNWLFRMLYNVFLNGLKGAQRNRHHADIDDVENRLPVAAGQESAVACREIADALDALPPQQRAAIVLVAVEGVPYDEAADMLGVPIGTVRSRLSRGRETLRAIWQEPIEPPVLRRVK